MGPFITLMVSLENNHQGGVYNGHFTNFDDSLIKQTLLIFKYFFCHSKLVKIVLNLIFGTNPCLFIIFPHLFAL
jgi:hypothetical protein